MPTWTAPLNPSYNPNFLPEDDPLVKRAMGHFSRGDQGRNVFIYSNSTASEVDPDGTSTFWNKVDGSPYVTHALYGAHAPETITAAESTILTSSGFGAYIT